MGRRSFGNIRKFRSGRYQARYFYRGEWHKADHTFRTKADAAAWLSIKQAGITGGTWIDPGLSRETFGEYANRWMRARTDLAATTRSKYDGLLRLHILPKFDPVELGRLSATAVRAWYHELRDRFSTGSTADDAYRVLRAIVNTAVTDGVIAKSPCTVKGAGSTAAAERPVASVAQLTAAIEAIPEQYRAGHAIAAWCQLRRGEILGLRRRHVDIGRRLIKVEQEWVVAEGRSLLKKSPKTAAGYRSIDIPARIIPLIEAHLERHVRPEPEAWLYGNGRPISPRHFYRAWEEARKKVALKMTLHDLRHSGLTWSARTGAPLAELMRRGGHSDPKASIRYQHATRKENRDGPWRDDLHKLT